MARTCLRSVSPECFVERFEHNHHLNEWCQFASSADLDQEETSGRRSAPGR